MHTLQYPQKKPPISNVTSQSIPSIQHLPPPPPYCPLNIFLQAAFFFFFLNTSTLLLLNFFFFFFFFFFHIPLPPPSGCICILKWKKNHQKCERGFEEDGWVEFYFFGCKRPNLFA
jgi:hypothetical protein